MQECKGCNYCTKERMAFTSVVGMCRWGGINFGWLFDLGVQSWCPINRNLPVRDAAESNKQGDSHESKNSDITVAG